MTFELTILIWECHLTAYLLTATSQHKLLELRAVIPFPSSTTEWPRGQSRHLCVRVRRARLLHANGLLARAPQQSFLHLSTQPLSRHLQRQAPPRPRTRQRGLRDRIWIFCLSFPKLLAHLRPPNQLISAAASTAIATSPDMMPPV